MRIGSILALLMFAGGAGALAMAASCRPAGAANPAGPKPLEVVPRVDLQRYLGTWYEIATIPQRFQKGCVGVTAHYSLRKDGAIDVVNVCR